MNLTDVFDRVLVVNLPERTDRRKAVSRELERAGMPLQAGKVEFFPAVRPTAADGFPSVGARGCFLSHLGVLKRARDAGWKSVLTVEDDLALSERFGELAPRFAAQLHDSPWDIVYLGHEVELADPPAEEGLVPYPSGIGLTHFLGFHSRVFDRLIGFLDGLLSRPPGHPDGGPMHVDGAFCTFRDRNPDVQTLIAWPSVGWQGSSRSDVYDGNWFDRTPLLRNLAGYARLVKRWVGDRRK